MSAGEARTSPSGLTSYGYSIEPHAGPHYRRNADRCHGDETPCAHCGRPVKEPWPFVVRIVGGGLSYAPLDAPDDGGAEMGAWPVGATCARVLRKAGVPVGDGSYG